MRYMRKITKSYLESPGLWVITKECGHRCYLNTRTDCKKPKKKVFCGMCYQENDTMVKL